MKNRKVRPSRSKLVSAATRHPQTRQPELLTHHFHIYLSTSRNSPNTSIITSGAFSTNSPRQSPRLYLLSSRRCKFSTHALTPPLTAAAYTRSGQHRVARQLSSSASLTIDDSILCQTCSLGTPYFHFPILLHLGLSPRFANSCSLQLERRTAKNFPVFTPPTTTLPLPLTNVRGSVTRQSD